MGRGILGKETEHGAPRLKKKQVSHEKWVHGKLWYLTSKPRLDLDASAYAVELTVGTLISIHMHCVAHSSHSLLKSLGSRYPCEATSGPKWGRSNRLVLKMS